VLVHLASNSATPIDHAASAFVPFGKFFHSLGKRLADAVHLAVDGGIKRGEPFVVHDQRLDFASVSFGYWA
jgi:hypothetical protein